MTANVGTCAGPARRRAQRGFTLVEIMIVVGIAALVIAWGVPSVVKAVQKDSLRRAVADVMEACSHARARAILQGVPMEIVIRSQDGQIAVQPYQPSESDKIPGFGVTLGSNEQRPDPVAGLKPYSGRLGDDIAVELLDVNFRDHMELDEARVRFFANGTCDEFTIVLRSVHGEIQKVSVDIVTGLARAEVIR